PKPPGWQAHPAGASARNSAELIQPTAYRFRPQVFDQAKHTCNHNYMNTPQADPGPADDATGTDNDTSAGNQGAGKANATEELRGWFTGRLPGDWFTAAPDIQADREEVTIVGVLPAPETAGASDAERAAAAEGRISRFREGTRSRRIEIAREAEHKFRSKVSW